MSRSSSMAHASSVVSTAEGDNALCALHKILLLFVQCTIYGGLCVLQPYRISRY